MRVLVAGATGAIGRPLVAALNARGHAVAGLTIDADAADLLSRLGAQPLVVDVLDGDATAAAILDARPEVVVEQLTALPRSYTPELMRASLAATGAVRTLGGDNVYAAAAAAGAPPPHVPIGPDTDPDRRFYAELLRGADNYLARKELGFDPQPLPWV